MLHIKERVYGEAEGGNWEGREAREKNGRQEERKAGPTQYSGKATYTVSKKQDRIQVFVE